MGQVLPCAFAAGGSSPFVVVLLRQFTLCDFSLGFGLVLLNCMLSLLLV